MSEADIIRTPAYRRAFNEYLWRGTPIEMSLKAERARTTHYIWRMSGDSKVRAAHAANNGKVFAWDNAPDTGHPGKDYGCRCIAEDFVPGQSEFAYQTVISGAFNSLFKWSNAEFVIHFYRGGGTDVTLSETGHLAGVRDYYWYRIFRNGMNSYSRVNAQIIYAARKHASGSFSYDFNNAYDFSECLYVFGESTVGGVFTGTVRHEKGIMRLVWWI